MTLAPTPIRRQTCEQNSAYRPVAILDDDPAKRRLRIQGIQVLGDRTRMAEVAARTGATVLVIAIARASGTAIRDLTVLAESCGLAPKVVPGSPSCSRAVPGSRECATRESPTCWAAGRCRPMSRR